MYGPTNGQIVFLILFIMGAGWGLVEFVLFILRHLAWA